MVGPFQTPQNEVSFSGLVDLAVLESGKTSSLRSVVQYANLTIRECQALGLSYRDLREEEVVATASPHVWTKPFRLRSIRAARYATQDRWPSLKLPGRVQRDQAYFFYAVDDSFVFKGVLEDETIQLATYYWLTPLLYYGKLGQSTASYPFGPYSIRPAYYDLETDVWMYLNAAEDDYITAITPADLDEEALRRSKAMHWILEDWFDMVLEGTKAKIFKMFNDDRAAVAYANYKANQMLFRNTGMSEAENFTGINEE